jgi:hypothetical protein
VGRERRGMPRGSKMKGKTSSAAASGATDSPSARDEAVKLLDAVLARKQSAVSEVSLVALLKSTLIEAKRVTHATQKSSHATQKAAAAHAAAELAELAARQAELMQAHATQAEERVAALARGETPPEDPNGETEVDAEAEELDEMFQQVVTNVSGSGGVGHGHGSRRARDGWFREDAGGTTSESDETAVERQQRFEQLAAAQRDMAERVRAKSAALSLEAFERMLSTFGRASLASRGDAHGEYSAFRAWFEEHEFADEVDPDDEELYLDVFDSWTYTPDYAVRMVEQERLLQSKLDNGEWESDEAYEALTHALDAVAQIRSQMEEKDGELRWPPDSGFIEEVA